MSLEQCILNAVAAGHVDRDRAQKAIERVRELQQRYEASGMDAADAAIQAGDDALESIVKEARSSRHATLRQLRQMQKAQARYAPAAIKDPDLIQRDVEHAQHEAQALEQSFMASISDFLGAFRTDVLGRVRGPAFLKEVVEDLHGGNSGNPNAAAIAKSVLAVQERARVLFNAQGGDIGKLADFGVSHRHDGDKIAAAGFPAWRDAVFSRLDWHRIVDQSTGKPFTASPGGTPNRAAADRFLQDVFDGITSGGWDDRFPSFAEAVRGTSKLRAEHRILHFKSGSDWWDYNEAFGSANAFEAVVQQLSGMARDIALMRNFGPNPRAGLGHAIQVMEKAVATSGLTGKPMLRAKRVLEAKSAKARVMLDMLSGSANRPADPGMARFFAGTRNLLTAAQLGGATLSQATDWASMGLAARAIGLNPGSTWNRTLQTMFKGVSPQEARDMGYIFDTWFDTGASAARYMGSIWAPELTSRITNTVMRANGMAFLTDRSRFGVAMAFGSDMAQMADRAFGDLDPRMRRFMETRGIGAREWDAVRDPAALFTDPTGGKHVSGDWFRRHTTLPPDQAEDIAIRWGALVKAHQEMAIPTASLRGRASVIADAKAGTIGGELLRSTMMYKSFMTSVLFNQLRRVTEIDGGWQNRAAYVAKYMLFMTAMGAVAVQLKEIAKGRDPRPMGDEKFWGAALLQGGGLGIFGDFFSATSSRAGGGFAETAGGPVVGLIGDVGRAVSSNAARAAEGKDMLIGRDVTNLLRRYNPAATYLPTRLAMDRLVWDQMQQLLDPEAEDLWRRQQRQQRKDYGNDFWWRRGQISPARGPDLTNAIGGGA